MEKAYILTLGALGLIALWVLFTFFGAIVIWWAWNFTMPFIFHLPAINFIQAFAIQLLAGMFKNFTPSK